MPWPALGEGGAQVKCASSILVEDGRRAWLPAPGRLQHSSPPHDTAEGIRLFFPREPRRGASNGRLTLVLIGPKLPAAASDKMEDVTTATTTTTTTTTSSSSRSHGGG